MKPPARRLPGEFAFALALLLFAVIALWQAFRIAGFASWSSPGAVPMLAALVMVGSGLVIVLRTARRAPADVPPEVSRTRAFANALLPKALVGFTLLIVLYKIALEPLGFIASSFLFLMASMWVLGSRRLLYDAAIAAISLAIIYVIFRTAFSVVLPEGVLEGLFR